MRKHIVESLFLLAIMLGGLFLSANTSEAYTSVRGYYRSNGTYVQPHVRSSPNALRYDNYSYSGGRLYNDSYYSSSNSYSSSWYTPSYYTDSSYYSGKSLYDSSYGSSYSSYWSY